MPFGLLVDLIFFILAGNKKNYIVLNEFEIGPDSTMNCGFSCPSSIEKIFYLLENYLENTCFQGSDRCPLGYLFSVLVLRGGGWFLSAPVPGHCLLVTYTLSVTFTLSAKYLLKYFNHKLENLWDN